MNKLPHLYKNRHGTFYLRIKRDGREPKRSLGTKDFARAKLYVLAFNFDLATHSMGHPRAGSHYQASPCRFARTPFLRLAIALTPSKAACAVIRLNRGLELGGQQVRRRNRPGDDA